MDDLKVHVAALQAKLQAMETGVYDCINKDLQLISYKHEFFSL